MVDIKDIQGNIILSTPIKEDSKRKFTLQKEDYVTLKFSLDDPIYFKLGYWVDTDFGLFELVDLYKPNYNQSTAAYDYELRLDAYYWKWKNKKLKYSPENAAKETSFSLTATLDVHAGIVLRNLSALGYKYRGVDFTFSIDSTVENKPFLMTYDNINILDACFQMASSAGCECWVTDNIIHFGRCEFGDPVDFELGVNVDTMKRSDSQTEYSTRIIAFGSTRNIPTNYRPTDDSMIVGGVVQKRLMLPVGTSYVDAYENMTEEEAVEDIVVFDDIYPRRVDTMSGVTTKQYTDKTENEDGTTTSEVWNAYRFKDSINFSKDYVISGQDLKIKFESGLLNGLEFGVTFNPDGKPEKKDNAWNPEAQIWEIVRNSDYGVNLPNDTLKPANGDKFVLSGFDITFVSDTYIPLAEQELLQKAQEYVAKTKIDPSTYDNKMMSGGALYEAGDRVNLINPGYFENGRLSRIIGFEYNLDIPTDSPIYTVGETAAYSRIGDIEEKLETITYKSQTYTGTGGSGIYIIRTNDSTIASNNNVMSALRTINEILQRSISKTNPDTAAKVITFIEGLISQGLIEAKGGIRLPSGAALYSAYVDGTLAFAMDENGFVIYEKGTANKWSVINHAGAEFQNLVIKFLAQITDLEVSNKATTLDLVVQALAKTHDLTVDNTADIMHGIIREYLTSESFVSGFLGSGFKIWKDANGDWCGEFDKLTVRKIFTIFELVAQKVVHQGGQVIRSAAGGKLVKVTDGGSYWKCEHDSTDDFLLDDQVLCQTFTGTSIKRYWRKVTSAGAGYFNLSKTDCEAGSANPEVGDDVAVLGNRTNTDRQSAQIDCAVGVNAPYRDDYAGINSYSLEGKLINRTGNLSGITDPDFGVLSGSGLIGMNAYLKGVFRLKSSGKLVEDAISDAQSESNAYTDGKITTVETNFEIREGQISTKVQAATTAATQASGYADAASTSATKAANSANQASDILTTVIQKETSINQTAQAIELKAVRAESAAGRAESAEASINLKADGIVLQASNQAAQGAIEKVTKQSSYNIGVYNPTGNAGIFLFKTKIPSRNNHMIMVDMAGYMYGSSNPFSVSLVFYTYYTGLTSYGYIVNGVDIVDRIRLAENNGFLAIELRLKADTYFPGFNIKISSTRGSIPISYSENWGFNYEYLSHGDLFDANYSDICIVPKKDTYAESYTKAQVQILSDQIALKVSNVTFNALDTRVTSAEQKITPNAIISTVSSTITTAKNEAINAAAADATTKANNAKSSAVSTAATDATTKANTAESNAKTYSNNTFTPLTTYNTKIAQLENSISLKADSTTVNGINTRLSSAEAKITSDAINLTVKSQITTAVDAVQVGGRNLALSSGSYINNSEYCIRNYNLSQDLVAGEIYTATIWGSLYSTKSHFGAWMGGGYTFVGAFSKLKEGLYRVTFTTPSAIGGNGLRNVVNIYTVPSNVVGVSTITAFKIEQGNKATDWTPAPEDVDASIALRPTTEEIKSQFTIDSSGISMMGKKIALTGLITFSSLDSSTQSTINGKATTGYVDTAKSAAINAAATDATTKANNAQSAAISAAATDATTKANSALASAKTYSDTLKNSLGSLAYLNAVSLAKLDSTIVEGGYIKTSLIDANAIITGSLLANKIAATDITTTRLTVSEGCTVGGFSIGSNRIGISASPDNVGSDGMFLYSSMIGFNAGSRQAIIGTYNTLGTSRLGQFIDTTSNYLPNVGIAFDIRSTNNGNRNYAFLGNGNGVLNGFVSGYGFREYSFAANNQYSVVGTLTSEFILVYFNYSNCAIVLPTLASMCDTLGISYTKAFTVRLTVISTAGNSGKLYGRSSSGISGISGYNYPELRDWNNAINNGGFGIDQGDSYELCMFYDGSSTSSVPSRSDAYRAYIINRQN